MRAAGRAGCSLDCRWRSNEIGVYLDGVNGAAVRFRWVKAPTSTKLVQLAQRIVRRVGHFFEWQGLLERDVENSYLAGDAVEAGRY